MKKSFIFIFLIYFILVPKYKAQNSDTVTLLSDYFLSDLSDSSDEIYIVDKIKHKISLLIKGHGKHKILGDNFNTNYLPKYAIIDGEKNYLLNNEIVLKEIASYSNVILEWDTEIYDCSYMFSDLSDIININLTEFNFKRITNMTCIFCNNKDLQYVEFGNFDSSSVISMEKMFYNCESLISLNFSLDMSNVENINFMFACCKNLTTINFNNYPTLSLKTMDKLFYNCNNLAVINLSSFYGNNEYINSSYMFYNCVKLKNIYFSKYNSFFLNSIEYMFYNCYELLSLNLSSFDTSSVINMRYMFYNCRSITSIDLSSFNTLKVKNMEYMFYNCYYLTSLNLTNFYALEDINMNYMFYYCYNIKYIDFSKTNLIHINKMDSMFYYCKSLSSLDLQKFETSKVQYMDNVFNQCYNLYQIKNIKFDLSSTNSMLQMFYYCESITSLDLSNLVNSKIPINMGEMFRHCNRLNYIDFPKNSMIQSKNMTYMFFQCYSLISVDLTSFDTSSAKTMSQLFYQCNDLISVNLTNFKTSNATFIRSMFYSCKSLTSLDLSSFNTSLVYDMGYMFSYCEKLIFVNLTSFNTSSVNNMIEMFQYCYALTSLDLKHFNVSKVTDFDNMFRYCSSLIYLNIFNFKITNLSPYMNNIFSNINKNFKYCLQDNNRFFNSSNGLFYLTNAIRDCSDNCYSYNKIYIPSSKLCVDDCKSNYLYEYNNECINICPKRTKASVDNVCILLNCEKYYNYEETDCLNELPERYYLKDPILKNIDICPIECKTCELEGISLNLCNLCNNNENYYPKYNDSSNIFPYIKCYQNIEGYYLDLDINTNSSFFKPCYYSCDKYNIKVDEEKHNCIICKNDYNYQIIIDNYFNCYDKETYYYFDRSINKYYFIQDLQCPYNYNKFISEKRKCIEECYIDNYYKFEFKKKCYDKCPNNTKLSENNSYYCEPICPIEKPFEILESQECVENCKIIMLFKKLCILNYYDIDTNIILDMINQNIISENFNFSDINYNQDILIEIKNTTFIVTKENNNIKDIDECEYMLRNYYNISNEEILIKLIIDNNKYEIYYSLNGINLEKLNLSLCNYICREPKCLSCTQRSVFYNLCITCNDNYYPKIYDASNIYNYINCYNNIEGYYLDINESLFKPCYLSCKICDIKGDEENHNCISCDSNYIYEFNYQNYTNCYEKCQYYFYYDNKTNKNYCTLESKCPKEYNKLIPMKNQCIEYCDMDDIYKYEFQKKCYSKCPKNTERKNYYCNIKCPKEYPFEFISSQECVSNCNISDIQNKLCIINYQNNETESVAVFDGVVNNIRQELTSGFDTSNIDKGENIVIEDKGIKLTITNTENQKNSEKDKNSTSINLGECETKLKEHYKIPLNKALYILKLDVPQEGMKIPKIEYEVYYNLDGKNLEKLDLSVCKNTKVDISIPVVINEDFDKLNTSSAYFNDICYTSSTNNGTDIILSDRKKEFIDNNKTICEENCDFTKYDYETGKAICSCNIKINIPLISKIKINKNKLFDSFTDINNIINYKIMKCYKILFTKNGFSHNYGSFILIPLFIFHIISIIISWAKGIKSIKNEINEIISAKINYEFSNDNNIHQTISDHLNQEIKNQNQKNSKIKNNNITKIKERKGKKKGKINKKTKSKVKSIEIDNKVPKKGIKDNSKIIMNQDQSNRKLKLLSKNNEECNKYKKILEPNESELNCLPYEKAKKLDKRTYCQFYFSLLKVKHLLLFSFVNTNDYNIRIIKIDLFFINFIINFTINALFFNDKTMHQIYEDSGEFNFIYRIPQILYSSLITIFLFTLLKLFALTENKVLEIKHKKETDNLKEKKADYFKIINIKIILFDITSIIMLLSFFYYIACFCAIYINTQIYLIKDTLVSFGISLLYPFFVYLISGMFRIPSLKDKKNERETMYNISKLFQML